ncbi:MAG: MGMT family protein [Spirochaetales bacterium]|nr:MGMT family protein [Spirochaetales bacterium]
MTEFTEQVIQIIQSIPPGKVLTYGKVAAMAGNPRGARQVARILHSMSASRGLPWYRVIGSRGTVSLPEGGGKEEQLYLLAGEGVESRPDGGIDLGHYLWNPLSFGEE